MVLVGTSTSFEIFMIPNGSYSINSMRLTNDGTPRRTSHGHRPHGSQSLKSSQWFLRPHPPANQKAAVVVADLVRGGGGIIGILAATLIALVGLVMLARKRRISAQNAATAVALTRIHPFTIRKLGRLTKSRPPQNQMGPHCRRDNPNPSLCSNNNLYVPCTHNYNNKRLLLNSQLQPQPYQPPQQQFVFSTHP